MHDTQSIFSGVAVTLMLHLALGAMLLAKQDSCGSTSGGNGEFEEATTIQAALAFKEVAPKNKQPQKKKKQKFKPKKEKGASKVDTPPPRKKEEKTVPVEPDEIDIEAIMNKNRKQDEDLSDTGSEEVPVEGAADGSQWGTAKEARGDPYVGELSGRVITGWKVPALETGTGLTEGCVKLNEKGEIVERHIKKRSKNSNLNRSVELALKDAPDMEEPVPEHLVHLLTVKGICINFKLE